MHHLGPAEAERDPAVGGSETVPAAIVALGLGCGVPPAPVELDHHPLVQPGQIDDAPHPVVPRRPVLGLPAPDPRLAQQEDRPPLQLGARQRLDVEQVVVEGADHARAAPPPPAPRPGTGLQLPHRHPLLGDRHLHHMVQPAPSHHRPQVADGPCHRRHPHPVHHHHILRWKPRGRPDPHPRQPSMATATMADEQLVMVLRSQNPEAVIDASRPMRHRCCGQRSQGSTQTRRRGELADHIDAG